MTELAQLNNWNETKIWKILESIDKPEAESVGAMLIDWMPKIQQLLAYAGTAPSDFTLHDSQHAFRVAERMVEVIPTDVFVELSTYELALLLLSAYLHDVGMSPNLSLVKALYDFLLFGDAQNLTSEDTDAFIKWVDGQEDEIVIPLIQAGPNASLLRKASLIISQYCRANHVLWGEQWINTHLSKERLGSYAQWVSDLKAICRSHNEGYSELVSDDFDPKPVGSLGMIVHPRYLAAVLRIADILELDPERTPEVVFEHRDISPNSIIYWHKDHYVSRRFENGRLSISAESPGARIHRAIEVMTDEIESELRLVRRLDDEHPFEIAKFQEKSLYHRWDLLPDIRRDIRPRNNSYEYINGAFRPNTQKILQLLSGKELYGNELVAVREILQNSFDAVREEIALQRLEKQEPSDLTWHEMLQNLHSVELRMEEEDGRIWLVCTDDGSGMSKSIIINNLLLSGNSWRRDLRILERRCRANGFEMERTGQFGIGVLSYFMLSDLVQIRTKRTSLSEDAETNGWFFETDGISSFGELRKDFGWRQGTQVRLRLRTSVIQTLVKRVIDYGMNFDDDTAVVNDEFTRIFEKAGDPRKEQWWDKPNKELAALTYLLINYLRYDLRNLPCKLRFSSITQENYSYEFNKGWTQGPLDLANLELDYLLDKWERKRIFAGNEDLVSLENRQKLETMRSVIIDMPRKIKECLSWITVNGELPNQLGAFRIHIPVFDLAGEKSNYFLHIIANEPAKKIVGFVRTQGGDSTKFILKPEGQLIMSWKGMKVTSFDNQQSTSFRRNVEEDALIEIDWHGADAGILSVSRERIDLSENSKSALEWLRNKVLDIYEQFAIENESSSFVSLTNVLIPKNEISVKRGYWLQKNTVDEDNSAIWGQVTFPATDLTIGEQPYSFISKNRPLRWQDKVVNQLYSVELTMRGRDRNQGPMAIGWSSVWHSKYSQEVRYPPDRLVILHSRDGLKATGLWTKQPELKPAHINGFLTEFPPQWSKLVGVRVSYEENRSYQVITAWNKAHPLNSSFNEEIGDWFAMTTKHDFDPRLFMDEILANKEEARLWLTTEISNIYSDTLKALAEQEREFMQKIWDLLFDKDEAYNNLYLLDAAFGPNQLFTVSPSNVEKSFDEITMNKFAPDPGPEWTLFF